MALVRTATEMWNSLWAKSPSSDAKSLLPTNRITIQSSPTNKPSTWLVTGASSGLGLSIAMEALAVGHKVIGTSRNITKARNAAPQFETAGGMWLELDQGQKSSFDQMRRFSQENQIDVLVNNAGYCFIGAIEDTDEEDVRGMMEVNYFGPLRILKAVLPGMRERKTGEVILISSGAGFVAKPCRGTYSSSKFAIEAAHEALREEIRSFNINVLIVEPGQFRTGLANSVTTPAKLEGGFSEPYKGTIVDRDVTLACNIHKWANYMKGDPDKAGKAIVKVVENGHDFLRLPLGADFAVAMDNKITTLRSDFSKTSELAYSMEYDNMA